jgi:predicted DCC family thiol-disulfide oxidoreductase YuxK
MKLLHQDATPETLNVVTVWVFGLWLLRLAPDPVRLLSFLPLSVYEPVGFLKIIPISMRPLLISPLFLYGLKIVMLLSLVLTVLNIFRKPAAVCACIFITVYEGILRGFGGHISHTDLILLYAAYFLALFPFADAMVKRNQGEPVDTTLNLYGIPLVAILTTICFTYTFVGVYRIVHGGIETFASGSIIFWALRNSYQVVDPAWGFGRSLLEYPIFSKMLNWGFPVITLFEVLAPVCLLSKRFRYVFLAVMIPFHFLSWFFMEVFFWANLLLFILFFDINRWLSPKAPRFKHPVIFFSGLCGICNRFMKLVLRHDRTGIYKFASLQGETALITLSPHDQDTRKCSIVFVDEAGIYKNSDSILRILSGLGGFWRIGAVIMMWIPKSIRDWSYNFIVQQRYRWLGKLEKCYLPQEGKKIDRFLP